MRWQILPESLAGSEPTSGERLLDVMIWTRYSRSRSDVEDIVIEVHVRQWRRRRLPQGVACGAGSAQDRSVDASGCPVREGLEVLVVGEQEPEDSTVQRFDHTGGSLGRLATLGTSHVAMIDEKRDDVP
jgi:hypothetical protein